MSWRNDRNEKGRLKTAKKVAICGRLAEKIAILANVDAMLDPRTVPILRAANIVRQHTDDATLAAMIPAVRPWVEEEDDDAF